MRDEPMSEEQIAKVKGAAATDGMVLVLKDGTKLYCESIEQGKKDIKTCALADVAYVEYGCWYEINSYRKNLRERKIIWAILFTIIIVLSCALLILTKSNA